MNDVESTYDVINTLEKLFRERLKPPQNLCQLMCSFWASIIEINGPDPICPYLISDKKIPETVANALPLVSNKLQNLNIYNRQ